LEHVDCIVIGAGVIGLACGCALAAAGLQTIVLEAESRIGSGVSSRSSEVIHAGLYYATGSVKATLCVQGREDRLTQISHNPAAAVGRNIGAPRWNSVLNVSSGPDLEQAAWSTPIASLSGPG
jgi:L-2-hydroxyglutarate oxidase LhgO